MLHIHNHLKSFFNWLVGEEFIAESPMARIAKPGARPDQIQPFSEPQVEALLSSAKKSQYPPARGPLPDKLYTEAKRRLDEAVKIAS